MTMWEQLTDGQRDHMVEMIVGAIALSEVPHHLRVGLVRYFSDGILPGGFMQAVLCNDLREAVNRATMGSLQALPALVTFLSFSAPPNAWGSRETVLAWTTTPERLEI